MEERPPLETPHPAAPEGLIADRRPPGVGKTRRPSEVPAARKIPHDEEIVAAATKVLLEEETIATETAFRALVVHELRRRSPAASLTGRRLRRLALRSGLVRLHIRVRVDGPTPALGTCLVCGGELRRIGNRTLSGSTAHTGYRCSRCPWWTGREFRIPAGYSFSARLARGGRSNRGQTRFTAMAGSDEDSPRNRLPGPGAESMAGSRMGSRRHPSSR
ncbi:MAG: hypothetical protein ACYDDF_11790 [Thermoplasmatota archaeon]